MCRFIYFASCIIQTSHHLSHATCRLTRVKTPYLWRGKYQRAMVTLPSLATLCRWPLHPISSSQHLAKVTAIHSNAKWAALTKTRSTWCKCWLSMQLDRVNQLVILNLSCYSLVSVNYSWDDLLDSSKQTWVKLQRWLFFWIRIFFWSPPWNMSIFYHSIHDYLLHKFWNISGNTQGRNVEWHSSLDQVKAFLIFDALIEGRRYISFCCSPLPTYKGIAPHDDDDSTDIIFVKVSALKDLSSYTKLFIFDGIFFKCTSRLLKQLNSYIFLWLLAGSLVDCLLLLNACFKMYLKKVIF